MIKKIEQKDIAECVKLIRGSFLTVAEEFGFTIENAPRFTAFATTEERLSWQLTQEHRPMYAFYDHDVIVGYYSLALQENQVLKRWYETYGFVHIRVQKFDFFPFTCGYMEKIL